MLNIFTKNKTESADDLVIRIHNEIDSLEAASIKSVEELLETTKVVTQEKLEKKARLMEYLGFSKENEVIQQLESLKAQEAVHENVKEQFELINTYRSYYANEKIILLSEFQKVLAKYGLIYAPAIRYIKDVPEKNLLEIEKAKELRYGHIAEGGTTTVNFSIMGSSKYKKAVSSLVKDKYFIGRMEFEKYVAEKLQGLKSGAEPYSFYRDFSSTRLIYSTLLIAAPKSHFNTEGLEFDGRGFVHSETIKVVPKDPIAFHMLGGLKKEPAFVRILSKWGTSDDQSYLDPSIQNEKHN